MRSYVMFTGYTAIKHNEKVENKFWDTEPLNPQFLTRKREREEKKEVKEQKKVEVKEQDQKKPAFTNTVKPVEKPVKVPVKPVIEPKIEEKPVLPVKQPEKDLTETIIEKNSRYAEEFKPSEFSKGNEECNHFLAEMNKIVNILSNTDLLPQNVASFNKLLAEVEAKQNKELYLYTCDMTAKRLLMKCEEYKTDQYFHIEKLCLFVIGTSKLFLNVVFTLLSSKFPFLVGFTQKTALVRENEQIDAYYNRIYNFGLFFFGICLNKEKLQTEFLKNVLAKNKNAICPESSIVFKAFLNVFTDNPVKMQQIVPSPVQYFKQDLLPSLRQYTVDNKTKDKFGANAVSNCIIVIKRKVK